MKNELTFTMHSRFTRTYDNELMIHDSYEQEELTFLFLVRLADKTFMDIYEDRFCEDDKVVFFLNGYFLACIDGAGRLYSTVGIK